VERAGGGGNRVVEEEVRAAEARVALAALGVEDPELRPPPRRTEPVPGDGHLRLLADDVASKPDPRPAGELEAEAGRFRDGGREAGGEARRLEGDEQRLRPTGEGREAAQPVGDLRGSRPTAGRCGPGPPARFRCPDAGVDIHGEGTLMPAFWQVDDTFVSPPSFTMTAEADETVSLDATALLVGGDPPASPESALFRIVDNAPDVEVTLADAPTVAGNLIRQRLRGLTADTTYRLRVSFLTSGNRRPMTLEA